MCIAAGFHGGHDALRAAGGHVPRARLGAIHEVDRHGDDLGFHFPKAWEGREA